MEGEKEIEGGKLKMWEVSFYIFIILKLNYKVRFGVLGEVLNK